MQNMNSELLPVSEKKTKQPAPTHFVWDCISLNTQSWISMILASNGSGISENFRNSSNFDELYLRAQEELGSRTGTVVKLAVSTFVSAILFFRSALFFVRNISKMAKHAMIQFFEMSGTAVRSEMRRLGALPAVPTGCPVREPRAEAC